MCSTKSVCLTGILVVEVTQDYRQMFLLLALMDGPCIPRGAHGTQQIHCFFRTSINHPLKDGANSLASSLIMPVFPATLEPPCR